MNTLLKDLRYAVRTLLKKPSFASIAILTLALGIGASTAIFTVVDAALLRGLPYKSPEQLYHLWERRPTQEFSQREFSYPDYQDYQQNRVFEGLAAYTGGGGIMTGRGEPTLVFCPAVSANFFSVLGVEPILGRAFLPHEDKPGSQRVAILTYGMWQRRFGSDPAILNQSLTINGQSYIVIGVLPASFEFALRRADLWLPYQPNEAQLTRRFLHGTNLIGRLKSNVSVEQAQSELDVIAKRIEQEHNQSHAGTSLRLVALQEQLVGDVKPILLLLLAAVGFVLLIACTNVASLLLTHSLSRQKEVAIRAALGASGWRVIRQMLTESVLLSLAGGAVGLLIAYWGIDALVAVLPENQLNALPFLKSLHIDTRILGFSFGLSLLTGIVFGLAPALQSSRLDLNEVLKEGGRTMSAGARNHLRKAFVMSEIALAVVLLIGAGLMLKSLFRLMQTNVGFDPQNVLTMTVALPPAKYAEASAQITFFDQLSERIKSLPGISGSGTVNILPLQGGNTTRFLVEGDPVPPEQGIEANIRVTDENYFQTLGIPLIAGRMFDSRDKADAPGVVIIGKTVADRIFAGRDPIGRRINYSSFPGQADLIVGVVGDVKIAGLDQAIKPVLYYPYRQAPSMATNLVMRTSVDPASVAGAVGNEIRRLEPDVAVFGVREMEDLINASPAAFMRRFPALLIGIFALVAILLASIGIYGVVSYSVSQQTHYIGVRMALGAQTSDILRMVLRQGLVLALLGTAIGVVAALGLMRLMESLLYQVEANDPLTFAIVVGTLFAVALLACYIPARRAAKVDPLVALRYE
ncbi:MAG TPA: ABC transporter permease [Pyrinomonadaceae bacterium]|nr:ABC transporter permease [Pyrinomonadaceae bacterium]